MQIKPHLESLKRHCRQENETAALATALGMAAANQLSSDGPAGARHINIALEGDLGAGKTAFARYLIQSLGYVGKVKSPTYSLCEPYLIPWGQHPFSVFHFDFYRMRSPNEWQEAGLLEHFDEFGICLIEWPKKAENTLPPMDLLITLTAGATETERTIELIALSRLGFHVLSSINGDLQ